MACIDCGPPTDTSTLPRSKWRAHPNFPGQLLLVNSHEGFRSVSRRCIDLARSATPPRADIDWAFRSWHRATGSHEAYEERKLYPYLARRYATSLGHLADDHARLHLLRDVVYARLSGPADDALVDALEKYDEELRAHLEREEAVVIPLLLDLPPEEFQRHYRASSVAELLASLPACGPLPIAGA